MIPLRLTVKNFMCYRDNVPTLDFESIHVACLCGDNGHGKSALLDAITWALWGQARARTQEELVHQGESDMAVDLDFIARGQEYRVSRRHSRSARGRQGATILELQVALEKDDIFRPITGNSVRDTELRICEILHMDYDTFVNTAFLLQGRADLFTRSTPSKRKECLAEVLDLSYYHALEERAKDKSRVNQGEIRDAELMISLRKPEIADRLEYEKRLSCLSTSLSRMTLETEEQRYKLEDLRRYVDSFRLKRSELGSIKIRQLGDLGDIAQLERQVQSHESKITEYQSLMEKDIEIREQHALLEDTRNILDNLDRALADKSKLEREGAEYEREIAVHKERLSIETDRLRIIVFQELEPKTIRIPEIEANIADGLHEQTRLDELEVMLLQSRANASEASVELERLNQALDGKNSLDQEKAKLESEIAVQQERLLGRKAQLQARISEELEPKVSRLVAIRNEISANYLEEQALSDSTDAIRRHRNKMREMDGRLLYLMESNETLRTEMEETHEKYKLLEQGNVLCPLCEQVLGEDGIEHLRLEYQSHGLDAKSKYQTNKAEADDLKDKQESLNALIYRKEAGVDSERNQLQSRAAALKLELDEAEDAYVEIESARAQLTASQAVLKCEDFAQEERNMLAKLDGKLSKLNYDPEKRGKNQKFVNELRSFISKLESELNQGWKTNQIMMVRLRQSLEDAHNAQEDLIIIRIKLREKETLLREEDFAQEERRKFNELSHQIATLRYDAEWHVNTRQQVKDLEEFDDLYSKLIEAIKAIPVQQETMYTSQKMLTRLKEEVKTAKERMVDLEAELMASSSREADLAESETRYQELTEALSKAEVEKGIIEGRLIRYNELEAEVKRYEEFRRKLISEKTLYDDLAGAFGKNGIQALIIESAIPQLEIDANELMGRLTENRMFLKLQLQEGRRDVRTGLPSEELDIKIADEIGTRSYETFSGGEAFRIDFALRIALSKLLARRSGAPLPILFIDEGFGSQDSAGQERLTEAIQSIQDDFQKIIVITHIEQIKEAFPVRIEVTKNANGSTYAIV